MGSLTHEIGWVGIEDSGNDLYFELDLLGESSSSTQYTLTWGCGYWQRYGPWYLTSGQYVSIGWYSDPSGSPSISTIQSNLNSNSSYYDSYWTRLNSVSDYTFNTSSSSGYYKEAVRCTQTFDRWDTNRRIILAAYCDPSASQLWSEAVVVAEYIIPAKTSDAPWSFSNYNVIYNPNGGTYNTDNQYKDVGTNLTLNTQIPVRQGFTFTGWNTKPDGSGNAYSAGGTYTEDKPLYLFAQWTPNNSDISTQTNKFITKEKFYRFITAVKSRLFPSNMADYIVDEGISKDNDHNWWWKWRHWNSGVSECWGLEYGQTTGYNTRFIAQIPPGIFIENPIVVAAMQINGMYGAWPNYHATGTNADGTTYIDGYINCDTGASGKNCWLRYYLRGVWK